MGTVAIIQTPLPLATVSFRLSPRQNCPTHVNPSVLNICAREVLDALGNHAILLLQLVVDDKDGHLRLGRGLALFRCHLGQVLVNVLLQLCASVAESRARVVHLVNDQDAASDERLGSQRRQVEPLCADDLLAELLLLRESGRTVECGDFLVQAETDGLDGRVDALTFGSGLLQESTLVEVGRSELPFTALIKKDN